MLVWMPILVWLIWSITPDWQRFFRFPIRFNYLLLLLQRPKPALIAVIR